MSIDPNDLQAQLNQLEQRRQMAQAMAQQNFAPAQQQVVNGRLMDTGIAPLVRGLAGVLNTFKDKKLSQQELNLQQQQNAAIKQQKQAAQDKADAALQSLTGNDQQAVPALPQQSASDQSSVASMFNSPQRSSLGPMINAPNPITMGAQPPTAPDDFSGRLAKAAAAKRAGVDPAIVDAYLKQAAVENKPDQPDKGPLDELAKLTADYKAGRISQQDFNARRTLMTTRAPNMYSDAGNSGDTGDVAKMIANYQIAPPSPMRMATPQGKALLAQVLKVNPDYAAEEFGSRSKAYKDFASGKQGDQVRAFNVGISHLNTASELADALNNTNSPIFNKIANTFAQQTGEAAPTNFDTAKQVVKGEIVKAVVGGQASQHDREEALAGVDRASSPAQLKGAIQTAQKLMGGQLGGIKRQYEQTTGRKDFERLLSEDAKPFLLTKEGTGDSKTPITHPPEIQSLLDKYK
jgi:hypothetical protein